MGWSRILSCLGVPGSFASFVSFLLPQSFCSSPVMGEIFFSFTSSHSSRVVCEGILRNLHLGTCCDKTIHL
jgi:hypothetical protein